MIGIGKMYRPIQILNIPGKRGYMIMHKYKSNFGGIFKFTQEIYLDYSPKTGTETVQFFFPDIEVPVKFTQSRFVTSPTVFEADVIRKKRGDPDPELPDKIVKTFDFEIRDPLIEALDGSPFHVDNLRRLSRPTRISSEINLEFGVVISSPKNESENDVLLISFMPEVLDGREYMVVNTTCRTPIVVTAMQIPED